MSTAARRLFVWFVLVAVLAVARVSARPGLPQCQDGRQLHAQLLLRARGQQHAVVAVVGARRQAHCLCDGRVDLDDRGRQHGGQGTGLLAARVPGLARIFARRPLARLHRRRRRREHQPAPAESGHRRVHRPHHRVAREPRTGLVARWQAPGVCLHRAEWLLQRLRDGDRRRQGRTHHADHDRQRLRPGASLLQPDRRAHLAFVVAGRHGAAARVEPRHPARLGRHLARGRGAECDGHGQGQADSQGRDALPHATAVVARRQADGLRVAPGRAVHRALRAAHGGRRALQDDLRRTRPLPAALVARRRVDRLHLERRGRAAAEADEGVGRRAAPGAHRGTPLRPADGHAGRAHRR